MAATIVIKRWTGATAAPSKLIIDSGGGGSGTTRASTSDSDAPGSGNPIPVPTSGTNYSFWVTTRLNASTAPASAINNIKWYSDGTNSMGTGVSLKVTTASAYVSATGTVGTTGNILTSANDAAINAATSDAFGKTSASPMTVAGSIGASTGDFGDFVVFQVEVSSTAGPGTTTAETLTFQYDET